MVRAQLELSDEQAEALKRIAAERGVSVDELIRQSVERIVAEHDRKEKWRRAYAVMGRYNSGLPDLSVNHDKYLAEDFDK